MHDRQRWYLWTFLALTTAGLIAGCGGAAAVEPTPTVGNEARAPTPGASGPTPAAADGGTADPTGSVTPASGPATPPVTAAPVAPEGPSGAEASVAPSPYHTVTVQSGDTLLGLALDHGVPMAAIQLQNDLGAETMVRLGQPLVIPPGSAWEGASPFWIVHPVSAGETLSEIARAYDLTLGDLQGANGLADADLLSVGQRLVLPLTSYTEARPVGDGGAATREAPVAEEAEGDPAPNEAPRATATPVPAGAVAESPPTPTVPAAQPAPAPPPADVTAWPRETVRIMNEVRAAHGLPPLAYNETLARAAQIQANDCAARGSCSHTGSDGSTIKERILRVGYDPATWAECWAIRPTPQGAIDIWMDEVPPNDPHRRTLLTTWLTEIGVGVAETTWGYYFIADFGRPR